MTTYDLEERTATFGEHVIKFCKKVPQAPVTLPLINQLTRSSTSVGANYCEADEAESRKDFRHKICICKKEARESRHWLRMISNAISDENLKQEARVLWQEAQELKLIFNAIVKSTDDNNNFKN